MSPGEQVVTRGYYSVKELVAFGLPEFPGSPKGWYDLLKREGWEFRDVPGKGGKSGMLREYKPPPHVMDLIEQRLQGTLPPAPEKAPAPGSSATLAAPEPSAPLYTYRGGPEWGGLEPDPGTTALVARCIVAAENLLGDAYTRQQQVTLAIDVWGALRRMFYGREAENIQAIADADLELLTRFVFNTKRALNSPGS